MTTLRSGRVVDLSPPPHDATKDKEISPLTKEAEDVPLKESDKEDTSEPEVVVKPPTAAPFPQRLIPSHKGNPRDEVLDVIKQVKLNLPFLDAIKQIPAYAKVIKDLLTVKRKMKVKKNVCLE